MNLTEIIGKQIFDIYSSNILGTIHEANFDKYYKRVLGFYFFDQDENEYYIKSFNIYSIDDYVTIRNISKVSKANNTYNQKLPLGKNVIDISGKNMGALCDIELNDKYEIVAFCTNKHNILSKDIMQISTNIVVGTKKISSFAPKIKSKNDYLQNISVSIMKIEENDETFSTKLMPPKITINSDILLGKKLSKDIIGKNNELIIKQNQIITSKQIILAKQHDKLNELFYSVY